ncbi:MAG: peptide-N-glycosidase F-related protein, partial [Myxococcota bacterium]|nr:peptide-N-glycosidase F-related protein [Myxococcota bacterium]
SIQLILDPESESPESVEIIRYITPYGKQMYKYVDITPMASLLQGKQTLSSWIDTWVGPGHSDGDGWRVTTQFIFYPGPPAAADEVINIWGRRNITVGQLGEGETVADQIAEQTFSIPADATRVEAHLVTTGHSFGNTLNCAEFCEMRHDLYINGTMHSVNPWRSDCEENPVSPQFGSWEHDRNGWCPGAVSIGDVIDITDSVDIGGENTLNFDILRGNGAVYNNVSPVDLLPYTILSLKLYIYR